MGSLKKNRKKRPGSGLQKHKRSIVAITAVIILLCGMVIVHGMALKKSNDAYKVQEEELQTQIDAEKERSEEINKLKKYVGTDGNTYEGYYNLFNIGATGSGRANVITNGLIRAKQEGWTSMAASINGGGNFVGEDYIDVGQNTLYLQKFCVYNKNGSLYWHQYMTNLLAAKSEASILLKNYQITGAQQTKNFEFVIPVYENMPKDASPEPTGEYSGTINTELISIDSYKGNNGNDYIGGYAYIGEYINGNCGKPKRTPKITLKNECVSTSPNKFISVNTSIGSAGMANTLSAFLKLTLVPSTYFAHTQISPANAAGIATHHKTGLTIAITQSAIS